MKSPLQKLLFFWSLITGFTAFAQPAWNAEICNVTVDSATASYITVMWNKPSVSDIDSFYIFRTDSAPWVWNKVGVIDYADSSVFDDISVDVNNHWYKYKISAIDFNGIEGPRSTDANTCWLDVIPNVGSGYYTCQWNTYNNFANSAINQRCIWDSLGGNPSQQVGGIMPTAWTSWNHSGYSLATSSTYRLEVFLSSSCSPSRAIVNTSRSNIKNIANPSLLIQTKEEAEKLVRAYPNPASENITLEWNASMGVKKVEMVGLRGELILSFVPGAEQLKKIVSLNGVAEGVYFVRFHTEKGIISKRLVTL